MIFVRAAAGEPIDVDAHLGGAEREIAPLGLPGYARFARRAMQRAMNWKLVIDTFLEAYHVPSLHRRSLGPTILGTPAAWDAFGRAGRLVAVRRSIADMRRQPEHTWNLLDHSVVLYLIFPNTILIHQVDHVEIVQAYPGAAGPDTTTGCVRAVYAGTGHQRCGADPFSGQLRPAGGGHRERGLSSGRADPARVSRARAR